MAFRDFVEGLSFDHEPLKLELSRAGPGKRYLILFAARSGSSWISSVLRQSNHFGVPREYINPNSIPALASRMRATDPHLFLNALCLKRSTPNRVFGMKVTSVQIEHFGPDDFFQTFDDSTVFFNLWRENIIAQGVSLYRAIQTKRFHSRTADVTPPAYRANDIRKWVARIARVENQNCQLLARRGGPSITLKYEDCAAISRTALIDLFAKSLEVDVRPEHLAAESPKELKKIGDDWNLEAEQRFRATAKDFVREVEVGRLVKGPRPETSTTSGASVPRRWKKLLGLTR